MNICLQCLEQMVFPPPERVVNMICILCSCILETLCLPWFVGSLLLVAVGEELHAWHYQTTHTLV